MRNLYRLDDQGNITGLRSQSDEAPIEEGYHVLEPPLGLDDIRGKRFDGKRWVAAERPRAIGGDEPAGRLHRSKMRARRDFADYVDRRSQELTGVIPSIELPTWAAKDLAADRFGGVAGSVRATDRDRLMLAIEAALVGEQESATLARIEAQRNAFYIAGPAIAAERRRFNMRVDLAPDSAAVDGELELARTRLDRVLSNLAALAADPRGFAATLPQEPPA